MDSLPIADAIEQYITHRRSELSLSTVAGYQQRLSQFNDWCDDQGIETTDELTGKLLYDYRLFLTNRELSETSVANLLVALRVFIKYCEDIELVPHGLAETIKEMVQKPNATRNQHLSTEFAETILEWLSKYRYGSRDHAIMRLLWTCSIRLGTCSGIDLGDVNKNEGYIRLSHRPDTGTPLKNGDRGERMISLDTRTTDIISDYCDVHRKDTTDEYGRHPLFTTIHGRVSNHTIRLTVYRLTRPCLYTDGCPVDDRDPDDCEARQTNRLARECPDSLSAHPVRRGSITHHLREGIGTRIVSERANANVDVLKEHYDVRTKKEQMENREDKLDGLF